MLIFEVNFLISILIGIDIVLFVFLILLFKRFNRIKQNALLDNEIRVFESLIKDSDITAGQFNEQLKDKVQVIKKLDRKLDKRIAGLKMLLNRSDMVLAEHTTNAASHVKSGGRYNSRRLDILKLYKDGQSIEAIARELSIPQGEVMLTLNMYRKTNEQPGIGSQNQILKEVSVN
jgi:ketosteroid isomerase-like protein